MTISVRFTLLSFWMAQGFVSCANVDMPVDFLTVALGETLTLNCTYNCSSGFVRGCWSKASDNSGCLGRFRKSIFCTVSLRLSNVSHEDLRESYTCYTVDTDDFQLPQKIERIVLLQLRAQTSAPNGTVTPKPESKNASLAAQPKDSIGGEFIGIKALATVTIVLAVVFAALAAYLYLNRGRQSCICKGKPAASRSSSPLPPHSALSPLTGPAQSERPTLRISAADSESDIEVPYADIMITVRGVSTPELTQVGCLTPGDRREWWGDDPRPHLHNSRSADRLHVPPPRGVRRKMSTSSEYGVIAYA